MTRKNEDDLYSRLMEAYSDASLNRITAGLLTLYRSEHHEKLRALARNVSAFVPVDDISPLFGLEHLEYVSLLGNPVPPGQIARLKDSGCTVLF